MPGPLAVPSEFEVEVTARFGILPNFFRSAAAAPELIQQIWGFARAGYLDNPMPSLFKERLFVWLSRFCPVRYCIVRHVGFLLGGSHGHAGGDGAATPQAITDVIRLLREPSPWRREMAPMYARLEELNAPLTSWPAPDSELEDAMFACAALMFVEPPRSARARKAMARALGARRFELFSGCLAFIRTAHYWTMLHPEIETEDDMRSAMRDHEELARLLLDDPEAGRSEMGERLFQELTGLRELNERHELEQAKRALEEKDRQKDEFIAILAHELRNPLGAIRAAADALGLIPLADPRATRAVERLERQTTAMARMLDDLLDASRIELGKVSVHLERVNLRELLANVLEEHQTRAHEAGLRLVPELASPPCEINADPMRFRQILDNLLSNAIKFTPPGGTIRLSLAGDERELVVTVADSGVGFDDQFAGQLFEPFTQRAQGRDRAGGGLGLGLAIASRLATLQGGSLSATSEGLDHGAVFTLRMPIADRSDGRVPADEPAAHRPHQTVLVVEDNQDMAAGLAAVLELTGFDVRVAHDGTTALVAALERVPDFIVCDLGLPGSMDGFAVARACRNQVSLRSVRLVAVSGYSSPQDFSAAEDAGFEQLLTKPVTRESLLAMTGARDPSS